MTPPCKQPFVEAPARSVILNEVKDLARASARPTVSDYIYLMSSMAECSTSLRPTISTVAGS